MNEQERALLYRQQQQALEDAKPVEEASLGGSSDAARALRNKFDPLREWRGYNTPDLVEDEAEE